MMLLDFVSKSKLKKWMEAFEIAEKHESTPALFNALAEEAKLTLPQIDTLKNAILSGNTTHEIFNNVKCDIWLTYLYQSKQINDYDFLQTYFILLAKHSFETAYMVSNQASHIKACLQGLSEQFNRPIDELTKDYDALSNINQAWIVIPELEINQKDRLLNEAATTPDEATPLTIIKDGEDSLLVIPSVQFVNLLLKRINPEHDIIAQPIFGTIGTATLYEKFHMKHLRPISLYSTAVKSNLIQAHGFISTPFSIAIHDFYFHYAKEAVILHDQFSHMITILMLGNNLKTRLQQEIGRPSHLIEKAMLRLIDLNPSLDFATRERAVINWLLYISPFNITQKKNGAQPADILNAIPEVYYKFIVILALLIQGRNIDPSGELVNALVFSENLEDNQFVKNGMSIRDMIDAVLAAANIEHLKNMVIAITLLQGFPDLATPEMFNSIVSHPNKAISIAISLFKKPSTPASSLAIESIFSPQDRAETSTYPLPIQRK